MKQQPLPSTGSATAEGAVICALHGIHMCTRHNTHKQSLARLFSAFSCCLSYAFRTSSTCHKRWGCKNNNNDNNNNNNNNDNNNNNNNNNFIL